MTEKKVRPVKTRTISFTADAFLVYSPEAELQVLAKLAVEGRKVDWKPAIVMAAAYLEAFGKMRLKEYFRTKGIEFGKMLEEFTLSQISTLLCQLKIVKQDTKHKVDCIRRERNDIVHLKKGILGGNYLGDEANKKYEPMIKDALQAIEALQKSEV